MNFQNIRFNAEAGIARVYLHRPDKLNSFTKDLHLELRQALNYIQDDKSIKVLVLSGSGRAFCAGQDLNDESMQTKSAKKPDLGQLVETLYKPLIMQMQNLRVPTLAAVNGIAAGAGASLALACDLVIATESAYFLQAFSKIGLIPDTGGTWFLTQKIGLSRAMGLAMLAEKLPAKKAADWGLIWDCVADDEFSKVIDNTAQKLAQLPTLALIRTRQAMQAATTNSLEQQLSIEAGLIRELGWRDDYEEGVSAFLEKRPAKFTGS